MSSRRECPNIEVQGTGEAVEGIAVAITAIIMSGSSGLGQGPVALWPPPLTWQA